MSGRGGTAAAVTYRPRRGPRPVRHVSEDGRLVHSLSVQGIYRLAESSAADLETVLAGPPGEPIPLHLDLHVVTGGPDVLDVPRPTPGRVHDLHRRRTRRGLHRAHIRRPRPLYGPELVRNFSDRHQRTRSPAAHPQRRSRPNRGRSQVILQCCITPY